MPMFNKKTSSRAIDATVSQAVNFEMTIADLARRSERRAWWVAGASVVLALILAGGYFYMLPLKQKVPFLVMADAATGVATVARLTDDATLQRVTTSEAVNRSNVAHFVLAREAYDAVLLNLRDWNTVLTMSSSAVANGYTSLYKDREVDDPDNPNPRKKYGHDKAIRVKINSMVLTGDGLDGTPKSATVRFQRAVYDKKTGATSVLDHKVATLGFIYKPTLRMEEQVRLENPLGFQVTAYRVDNDYSSPLPAEVPVAAPPPEPSPPPPPPPPPVAEVASAAAPAPAPVPDEKPARRPRRPRNAR
jgi:type IV secretion system protein VirB8